MYSSVANTANDYMKMNKGKKIDSNLLLQVEQCKSKITKIHTLHRAQRHPNATPDAIPLFQKSRSSLEEQRGIYKGRDTPSGL